MSNKHEWRKKEKAVYLPTLQPTFIDVPTFKFISLRGACSPDEPLFAEVVGTLYSNAYTIKMQLKANPSQQPNGYNDYTVYPLEGVWDINNAAKKTFTGTINKADLSYQMLLRQPDFVSVDIYQQMLELVNHKKHNPLFDQVVFDTVNEGRCIQMLHIGPFENEPESFAKMETFGEEQGYERKSKLHREIYLSDPRRTAQEKLKTVLRYQLVK